ncbi:MAG TPA: SDR family oxidoreductase [Mycobacteriales bacterium]|jgi:NAD(P)-dependent dehydrogenase (short-subunit alcohol dehydrogenase family)|nr:SDR family oxidoreductase [Mycobacteriales bacterium]
MTALCDGRIVIVTGAGRGIGREEALEFARQGARVVVNDVGGARDGTGEDATPAQSVVDEIKALGAEGVANYDDISDFDGAKRVVQTAIESFGGLDVVVNNAGILRDRMLVNMTIDEWDAVIKVHLRGTFAMAHHAAVYWRERSKAGDDVDARLINTSSSSGIYGNVGQSNYGAAKAGIAAFTVITAMELQRYGVTVNAVAPAALTRMTEDLVRWQDDGDEKPAWDPRDPSNIAPLVAWLGSKESRSITGRVFNVKGGYVSVAEGWVAGPAEDKGARWEPGELGEVIPRLVAEARANSDTSGATPQTS